MTAVDSLLWKRVRARAQLERHRRESAFQGRHAPQTDGELHEWVRANVGISIPNVAVCAGHSSPFEAFANAYFARDPISVWKASRGFGGKSLLLATLAYTEVITLDCGAVILGGSGDQSRRVHSYITGEEQSVPHTFWNHPRAPRQLLATLPSQYRIKLTTGAYIHALSASQKSVRGAHPQRLRLDEIDEMALAIFDAATGQPMRVTGSVVRPQTVASSTHHNPSGTMSEILNRAEERGWPVFEWCYRESMAGEYGWLSEDEVAEKRAIMTSVAWETEVELQEPSGEDRAIDGELLLQTYNPLLGSGTGKANEELIFEEPEPGARYATGTDVAKTTDWTICKTYRVDVEPAQLVAWARWGRVSWPRLGTLMDERHTKYPGRNAHDGHGAGAVLSDYLKTTSEPYVGWSGAPRNTLLSDYVSALEHQRIEQPRVEYDHKEHQYATNAMLFGVGEDAKHLPDSVAAGALAWRAIKRSRGSDTKGAKAKYRAAQRRARRDEEE